ncbi:unnamed protein product [Rotaria sordida]|uniref:NAD-dependent epimerase/dehydratase domain-containing protein n=1 Tax=Rotaria sordida TaxID=392033 RepID=A0A814RK16_9BILA|nr:unnamed protein product [Rotaria sordida]CAF1360497.1 unnamed protein product [Rotaria sordida]
MNEISSNEKELSANQQRILIIGVSGLIGRLLFNHLTKTYPTKYEVLGLDQHMNISPRYQFKNYDNFKAETIVPLPLNKFFQCDITDREKLHQIIKEQNIKIIIHLAALLETHPDIEQISYVNIEGTKNVFEAPDIHRIIYASSGMVVHGYLDRQPYLSIFNETFDDNTILKDLRKITVADDPPLPDLTTPGRTVYSKGKIICEQMATDIVKNNSKSIICARFGAVNIEDKPETTWNRSLWLSHRDLCSFISKALEAPLNISGIYFVMSNNHRLWVDLEHTKRDLGYVPQDGAEKI